MTSHFLADGAPINIEGKHIQNAIHKREIGRITERELADWASFVLMCDLYGWQGPDEDRIAQNLNDLAFT